MPLSSPDDRPGPRWWGEEGPTPALLLALVLPAALLLGLDVWEDLQHGGSLAHALAESAAIAALLLACGLVLRATLQRGRERVKALQAELAAFRAARPSAEPAPLPAPPPPAPAALPDPTARVEERYLAWRLTPAEQEVAWLLLKGVSLNDIAAARGTSPRTARDQARAIYRKAQVAGRAELSGLLLDVATEPPA